MNIAKVLKSEILRLARKEVRGSTAGIRKASSNNHKTVSEMTRRLQELERKVTSIEKRLLSALPQGQEAGAVAAKFSARSLRAHRKHLGLSAEDYGRLLGVSANTVYAWEQKKSKPRQKQVEALSDLRHLGKKEARDRLGQPRAGKEAKR